MRTGDRSFRRRLPHVRRDGAEYAVTWRLARDQATLQSEERDLVFEVIAHFEQKRFELIAAVVMDDHVHLLVRPFAPFSLSKLVHTWKSYSAHQLVRLGRRSPVWQDECYDSIIRDRVHRVAVIEYIRNNPAKRWPGIEGYRWLSFPQE